MEHSSSKQENDITYIDVRDLYLEITDNLNIIGSNMFVDNNPDTQSYKKIKHSLVIKYVLLEYIYNISINNDKNIELILPFSVIIKNGINVFYNGNKYFQIFIY